MLLYLKRKKKGEKKCQQLYSATCAHTRPQLYVPTQVAFVIERKYWVTLVLFVCVCSGMYLA